MRTTGKATDLITFSRSSGGTALRKIAYGPELVTNGTFDTDSDWTKGTGWTISGGIASHSAPSTGNLSQTSIFVASKVYLLTYTLGGDASGGMFVYADSGNLSNQIDYETTTGEKSVIFVADGSNITFRINTAGTIDNVSVKEVLFDQPDGTLTLFNHPADVPRIEYDADGNVLGLLVEESRTNLNNSSGEFSLWAKTGTTESSGLITAVAGSSAHRISRNIGVASSPAVSWADLKAETHSFVTMYDGASVNNFAYFDLSNGTVGSVGSNTTATIKNLGSGVYRCACVYGSVNPPNGNTLIGIAESNTGTWGLNWTAVGTESIRIFRHQLEAGAFPTSYIPTAGATATRSADVASIPVADFGYNQSEGTVVVEYSSVASLNENYDFFIFNTNSSFNPESWGAYGRADGVNNLNGYRRSNSAYDSIDGVTAFDGNSGGKIAISQSKSNTSLSSTGLLDFTAFSLSNLSQITELDFANGSGVAGGSHSGHIKSIKYYPRKLTNAQLQEQTT